MLYYRLLHVITFYYYMCHNFCLLNNRFSIGYTIFKMVNLFFIFLDQEHLYQMGIQLNGSKLSTMLFSIKKVHAVRVNLAYPLNHPS